MGLDDEFIDRERDTKNAEYDSTVDILETEGILPIKDIPNILTINGFGRKLYGRADYHKESNSYITTLYYVFLFIPILPLKRFRVKLEGGYFYIVSSSNTYTFMWELPLTKEQKIHRNIFFIALAVLIISIVINGYILH